MGRYKRQNTHFEKTVNSVLGSLQHGSILTVSKILCYRKMAIWNLQR